MTITLNRIETNPILDDAQGAHELADILRDALGAVALVDPDLLHSHTIVGQAAIALADAGREAAAALGAERGTGLGSAPGVVVVRDLVAAASHLEMAATSCAGAVDPHVLRALARKLSAASRRLLLSLPATT